MIGNERVLALITARGGSKGFPRKNLHIIGGKPLLAWTVEQAKMSRYIDRIVVSSEDEQIIEVARNLGCDVPFRRSADLARDETPTVAVIVDVLERLPGFQYVVLLQPTSPLRSAGDIDECIVRCSNHEVNSCVSVTPTKTNPFWMYSLDDAGKMLPVMGTQKEYVRRQDLPEFYALNGAVYVARCSWFLETRRFISDQTIGYVMPNERSLDIDTELDFKIFKALIGEV